MKLPKIDNYDKLYFGFDLAKKDSQLAILDSNGTELTNFRFPSTRQNFLEVADVLRDTDTIALEVSTSANAVMSIFKLNSDGNSLLSNPMQTKPLKSKTSSILAKN